MARTKQPSNASSRHSSRSSSCRHSKSEKSPRRGLRHRVYALCQACATTRRRGTIIRDRGAIDLDEPLKELDNAAMSFAQTVRLLNFDHATARRSTMPCRPSEWVGSAKTGRSGNTGAAARRAIGTRGQIRRLHPAVDLVSTVVLVPPEPPSPGAPRTSSLTCASHSQGTLARNFPTYSPRIPTTCGLW